nr:hypothetical protein [Tanacetum cinerariifolium]
MICFLMKWELLRIFISHVLNNQYDDLENGNLDTYEPRQFYDEYERMFAKAVILNDDRLVKLINITLEQWLDHKFGVNKEIIEVVVGTWLMRSYGKEFKKYMEIKWRLEDEEKPWLDDGTWKEPNDDICHELEDDDDDIGDLDDYLIPQDASYYVDEEEERFIERKSKLLGIPYEKPPMFKSKKFKVIKYSLGPAKEYVAIKEYESCTSERVKVYYECKEKVVTPLIEPAIKGFVAASAVLKPERLKVDRY